MLKVAGLAGIALFVGACSSAGAVATVDGVDITRQELAGLAPSELEGEELATDLSLLVLHTILTAQASTDFGVEPSSAEILEALEDRVPRNPDDAALAERGTTRRRVEIEAELDVIRDQVEAKVVESDAYGFDFDAAYRNFLGVNSRVCLRGLGISDTSLIDEISARVDEGADIATLDLEYPDGTDLTDLGCTNPVEHGTLLAPVALDGEIGVGYIRQTEGGQMFVVEVTDRDAPAAEDVQAEVMALGRERQAPGLFDAWAVEALQSAVVTIDESIGAWRPGPNTGDVPTVVPPD